MAMVVKNNMSAVSTLNTLNKNQSALGKSLQKVSSGMKINSAQDDASGYAISERMRTMIRSLDQANQNTQNGSSMMKVAEGAVSNTVEILKTLKEKAINAATDTNTDEDRAIIQKEIDQLVDQVDDNALITFNGKYLLDGSKASGGISTKTAFTNQKLAKGTDYSSKLTELYTRKGDKLEITTTDKVTASYVIEGNTYTTSFDITSKTTLEDVFKAMNAINGAVFGPAHLEINDMTRAEATNVYNQKDGAAASLQAYVTDFLDMAQAVYDDTNNGDATAALKDNTTALTQANTLHNPATSYTFADGYKAITALANLGELESSSSARDELKAALTEYLNTNFYEKKLQLAQTETDHSDPDSSNWTDAVTESTFNISFTGYNADTHAMSNAADHTYTFTITGDGGTANAEEALSEHVEKGINDVDTLVNDLLTEMDEILDDAVTSKSSLDTYTNTAAQLYTILKGLTLSGATAADYVSGKDPDSIITANPFTAAAAATIDRTDAAGDLAAKYFARALAEKAMGTIITAGNKIGLNASGDIVKTADATEGLTVTAAQSGIKGQISGLTINITDSNGQNRKTINEFLDAFGVTIFAENESEDFSLKIHTGAQASQSISVGLMDMRSEALGLKGADGTVVSVATRDQANAAISVFDNALQKALDVQTTIGAIESRLEYTSGNLTTSTENVQAAESTIRDADMAKEMTNYTKNNVLLQAAQSMLAQANQNSSAVLSLLQ